MPLSRDLPRPIGVPARVRFAIGSSGVMILLSAAAAPVIAQPGTPVAAPSAPQAVPFPHPVITEVFFHVPQDTEGDPSGDGVRDAVGDEFIEIANPHDRKIDITGYTITDRDASITFTFPKLSLEPGEIAVLFNGYNTEIVGPVGGATSAAGSRNPHFNNAWVFNLGNAKRTVALNNQRDRVVLSTPDGMPIDMVIWGETDLRDYISQPRIAYVKSSPGASVQRVGPFGELMLHTQIDGALFSPGWIPDRVTITRADGD